MSHLIEMLDFVPGVNPPKFAVDTSALSRLGHHEAVSEALLPLIRTGQLAYADPTLPEIGLTARNRDDHNALLHALTAMHRVHVQSRDFDQAWEIQGSLAARGQHRGVALPDLLVAAVAERLGLTVIHCDSDFDIISAVTGQPTRWAVDPKLL